MLKLRLRNEEEEEEALRKLLLYHPLDLIAMYYATRNWRLRRLIRVALKIKMKQLLWCRK